jgi:hypothetical protein
MAAPTPDLGYGLSAGFSARFDFPECYKIINTGAAVSTPADSETCRRMTWDSSIFVEIWRENGSTRKQLSKLASLADDPMFIRYEGIAGRTDDRIIVAYERSASLTKETIARMTPARKAHMLTIIDQLAREAGAQWAGAQWAVVDAHDWPNLHLDAEGYPILSRRAVNPTVSHEHAVARNLHCVKNLFVKFFGIDADLVQGYIDGHPDSIARVNRAACAEPPPQRAAPANLARRTAIANFWRNVDSAGALELSHRIERLTSPGDGDCLKSFLSTPVDGILPHMAILKAMIRRTDDPDRIDYTPIYRICILGADICAVDCIGDSAATLVMRHPKVRTGHIIDWCERVVGLKALKQRKECHAKILLAAADLVDALELFDYFAGIGLDFSATAPGFGTVLHWVVENPYSERAALVAAKLVEIAPDLLTTQALSPAFYPTPTVTPLDLAGPQMRDVLIAAQKAVAQKAPAADAAAAAVTADAHTTASVTASPAATPVGAPAAAPVLSAVMPAAAQTQISGASSSADELLAQLFKLLEQYGAK